MACPGPKMTGDSHMPAAGATRSRQLRGKRWRATARRPKAAVKVVARTHKTLIQSARPGSAAAAPAGITSPVVLAMLEDLDAPDTWSCWARAPDPARAARLTCGRGPRGPGAARRRGILDKAPGDPGRAARPQASLLPAFVMAAYAATARVLDRVIDVLTSRSGDADGRKWRRFSAATSTLIYLFQPGRDGRTSSAPGSSASTAMTRTGALPARPARTTPPTTTTRVGQHENRLRPVHPQRPAHRRPHGPCLRRPHCLHPARALYDAERARGTLSIAIPPLPQTRQPAHRHPARLPQDPHPLQRGHRLAPAAKHPQSAGPRRLTSKPL